MAELIPIANLRGPKGDKGDKGDPGSWNLGNNLGSASNNTALNLNDIRTPGLYWQGSTSTVTSRLYNYPPVFDINGSSRGHLRVTSWGGSLNTIQQEYITLGTGFGGSGAQRPSETWTRTYGSDGWSEWSVKVSQRVDNTVGRAFYVWDHTNGREQLIYGDTGDRDINDLVDKSIWNVTVAKLRRQNSLVELRLQLSPLSGNVGQLGVFKAQLPAGFRNQHTIQGAGANGANLRAYRIEYTGTQMSIYDITAGSGITLIQQWTTLEPWPTSLPGSPVGALPTN